MFSVWTQHLKDVEDIQNFKNTINSAKPVLDRLAQILKTKEMSLERSENDLSVYDNANWSYRQAHMNGYRSCLAKVQTILNLDQKDI